MHGPSLRRSYRWRLQLGVWKCDGNEKEANKNETNETEANETEANEANAPAALLLYATNHDRITAQRQRYAELLEKYKSDSLLSRENDGEKNDSQTTTETTTNIDPLTAMVMEQEAKEKRLSELDLKYRKEKAMRRKRGTTTTTSMEGDTSSSSSCSLQTLEIIHKDLHRLAPDHATYHHAYKNLRKTNNNVLLVSSSFTRTQLLTQLLFIHANEHSLLSYRQGMHEIASYLLLSIEMDLVEYCNIQQQQRHEQQNTTSTSSTSTLQQAMEELSIVHKESPEQFLLHPDYIIHDCYWLFEAVMNELQIVYNSHNSSQNIIKLLHTVVRDSTLHAYLLSLSTTPPELYTTRMLRLMFSREVQTYKQVLQLWDVFFDCIHKCNTTVILSMPVETYSPQKTSYNKLRLGSNHCSLLQVLQTTAACRIWMVREQLLQHTSSDTSDSIHLLMNMPTLTDTRMLISLVLTMLRRQQLLQEGVQIDDEKITETSMNQQSTSNTTTSNTTTTKPTTNNNNSNNNNNTASSRLSSFGQQLSSRAVVTATRARDAILQQARGGLSSTTSSREEGVTTTTTCPATTTTTTTTNQHDPLLGLKTHVAPVLHDDDDKHSSVSIRRQQQQVVATTTTRERELMQSVVIMHDLLVGAPEHSTDLFSSSENHLLVSEASSSDNNNDNVVNDDDDETPPTRNRLVNMADTLRDSLTTLREYFEDDDNTTTPSIQHALSQIESVRRQLLLMDDNDDDE